jgi:hypothetical protein
LVSTAADALGFEVNAGFTADDVPVTVIAAAEANAARTPVNFFIVYSLSQM